MSFAIIVAADEANGIGKDGRLPWHLPGDLAFFKRTTVTAPEGEKNFVIMGRKTYESIPAKFRPLKDRINVVLSRSRLYNAYDGTLIARSLDESLQNVSKGRVFVIGGGQIYDEALKHPDCRGILLTRVHARFDCDTHLAAFQRDFELTDSDGPHQDGDVSYTFETYARRT